MFKLQLPRGNRARLLSLLLPRHQVLPPEVPLLPLTSPFVVGTPSAEVPVVVVPSQVQGLPPVGDEARRVGSLVRWFRRWPRNTWAHCTVCRGLSWKWLCRPPTRLPPLFSKVYPCLSQVFASLLQDGVVDPAVGQVFLLQVFLVPKRDSDKVRLVMDLSQLNKFIVPRRFWMLTIRQVRLALHLGWWFTSVDLGNSCSFWLAALWCMFRYDCRFFEIL